MTADDVENKSERFASRRTFAKSLAGIFGVAALPQAAQATESSKSDDDLPIRAVGVRVHRFVPDADSENFVRRDQFTSSEVKSRNNGSSTVNFSDQLIPRDSIPQKYKNPDRGFVVKYEDIAVLGTFEQHMKAEELKRESYASDGASTSDVTIQAAPVGYYGPLYTYKSGDLEERTAPINLSWYDTAFNSTGVKNTMLDAGWGSIYTLSTDSYIGYDSSVGYITKKQDRHVKQEGGAVPGEQWHCRLFNYEVPGGSNGGHDVIGAVHRDPADHGWLPGDEQWRFSDSREKVVDTWLNDIYGYSSTNLSVGNGGAFPSSNGILSSIH